MLVVVILLNSNFLYKSIKKLVGRTAMQRVYPRNQQQIKSVTVTYCYINLSDPLPFIAAGVKLSGLREPKSESFRT
jgi:hypothetical protein